MVLRVWPVQEADLIVSLFTREAGKIRGVAKAGAKSRRRFGGALEPMTVVRAQYVTRPRQELVRLEWLEILSSPLSEPVDYARAAALGFYTEVLDEMLPDGVVGDEAQDAMFRLLLSVLEQTHVGRVWLPVTYFALWMVRLMGWMPELRRCASCGRRLADQEQSYWSASRDGLSCNEHRGEGSQALQPASRALAAELFHAPVERFAGESWPSDRAEDLRRFALAALERHREQRLASVGTLLKLGR